MQQPQNSEHEKFRRAKLIEENKKRINFIKKSIQWIYNENFNSNEFKLRNPHANLHRWSIPYELRID